MRTVFSRLAECDLEEIADYIAEDNPQRASSFIGELRTHCARIAENAQAFQARPELGANLRSSPHGRYVIFFRAGDNEILMVRILHGARDLSTQIEGTKSGCATESENI